MEPQTLLPSAVLGLLLTLFGGGCAVRHRSAEVERILEEARGTWGVYFRDLETGRTVEIDSRRVFHPASTIKVLVLLKVMRDVEDGKLDLDEELPVTDTFPGALGGEFRTDAEAREVRESIGKSMTLRGLVRCMMVESDNLASNLLIRKAGGPEAVTAHARRCGLRATRLARYIEDHAAFRAGLSSSAEPREVGTLLERLWRGEVVSEKASGETMRIMSQAGREWMGLLLPEEIPVAHKTGAIEGIRHDVGVMLPGRRRPLILCVFGEDLPDVKAGEEAIARIAEAFFREATSGRR